MNSVFTSTLTGASELQLVSAEGFTSWVEGLPAIQAEYVKRVGFNGQAGRLVYLPDGDEEHSLVAFGIGDKSDPMILAAASSALVSGDYFIDTNMETDQGLQIAAGWADGAYRFEKYVDPKTAPPRLYIESPEAFKRACIEADAAYLARDMINTPAQDMGPSQITAIITEIAAQYGASVSQIVGDELLSNNYPMVHAVGRAANDAPRYIELSWGRKDAPHIAIVGKGVSFDTGGLNIKTGNYMRLMKKDMGGAAHAIALAYMIMGLNLDVRLSLHIPTVENAISGNSFRPGDVLNSRKGLTVEIDNTDAEGRLILADALARASELEPDLLIDFATLTGAARIAMGTDVAPFFTRDGDIANALHQLGESVGDPLWQLPLWSPYLSMLKSSVADIVNGASSPFAGTITAALFLEKFVGVESWVHLDVWGWRQARYGNPEGGAVFGLRAFINYLSERYGLVEDLID